MGTQLPSPKGAHPQFSANVRCDQTAGWTKMPLGMEWYAGRPRLRRLCVRWGPSYPTQFLVSVYCGQTAGWMKTPLSKIIEALGRFYNLLVGTEVDLGSGHIVRDS